MSHKKTSQVGGTQTTPPPATRKSTSTGETQTSPPIGNSHRQVDQGQLANITSSKGKKSKKSTSKSPPHPVPSRGPSVGPRINFTSRNLGLAGPQSSAWHVVSIHTREGNAHMIIIAHVITMIMLHTCAGLTDRPTTIKVNKVKQSPQICVYCGSTEHSSSNCHRRPWDNREQPHSTPEFLEERPTGLIPKFWEMLLVGQPLWVPIYGVHPHSVPISKDPIPKFQEILDLITNLHNISEIIIIIMITGSHRGSLMQGLMKGTIRGTHPPVFPPTPSLNSLFPEAAQ